MEMGGLGLLRGPGHGKDCAAGISLMLGFQEQRGPEEPFYFPSRAKVLQGM